VLTGYTVTVPEGRVSALAGPDGAGKTTQLRMLAGLASPAGGTASVPGGAPRQDPDGAGLGEDGMVALFTSALRDFYERRGGPASGETEGVA
jgi:ABC-type uncharacterized transport system ATPase subunit